MRPTILKPILKPTLTTPIFKLATATILTAVLATSLSRCGAIPSGWSHEDINPR